MSLKRTVIVWRFILLLVSLFICDRKPLLAQNAQGTEPIKPDYFSIETNTLKPASSSNDNHMLNGGISQTVVNLQSGHADHAQNLAPLPSNLHKGGVFEEENLPNCACGGVWFKIPNWLAGKWEGLDVVMRTPLVCNLLTGQTSRGASSSLTMTNLEFGAAQDNTGQIWHYPCIPYKGGLTIDGIYRPGVTLDIIPLNITNEGVVVRSRYFSLEVKNNIVTSSKQNECITIYQPSGENGLMVQDSIKTFDENGKPISLCINEYKLVKVHNFQPMHNHNGNDLVKMFEEYLRANGMDNLIMVGQ